MVMRSHEAIRVVPLHHPAPRPVAKKKAKARLRQGAAPRLTYRGGPLIRNAEVFTIFWGKSWKNTASSMGLVSQLQKFFGDILVSPLIDQLSEYNVAGKKIGHGKVAAAKIIAAGAPRGSVTDSAVQSALKKWISGRVVPPPGSNTLYFIFLEPGVVSVMGGSRSCQSYCGYHSNTGRIYYAVMPYPGCAGCLGGLKVLDALTATSSHELCEAITDPVPGTGWYDDTHGEIGDICAWKFKQMGGYTVQVEWSNKQSRCI